MAPLARGVRYGRDLWGGSRSEEKVETVVLSAHSIELGNELLFVLEYSAWIRFPSQLAAPTFVSVCIVGCLSVPQVCLWSISQMILVYQEKWESEGFTYGILGYTKQATCALFQLGVFADREKEDIALFGEDQSLSSFSSNTTKTLLVIGNLKLGPSVFIWVSACSCFSCRSTSLSASQQTTVPLEECGKGAAWCVSMILLNANKGVQSHLHNQGL